MTLIQSQVNSISPTGYSSSSSQFISFRFLLVLLLSMRFASCVTHFGNGLESTNITLAPAINYDLSEGTWTLPEDNEALVEPYSKRTNVRVCFDTFISATNTAIAASNAAAVWYAALKSAAGSIFDQSTYHNCGIVYGYLAGGAIRYTYSASGSNCDTTAQFRTIQGGLDVAYAEKMSSDPNGIWCMTLSHGGSWNGYLIIGSASNAGWDRTISCSGMTGNSCVSGGNGNTVG